jgi:dipeptidyl-peptidase-4
LKRWPLLLLTITATVGNAAPPDLTLDRLYRFPWVIGTTPEQPVWSPDSKHLAFLWSDDGTETRDVYWTDPVSGRAERLTEVSRLPLPTGADPATLREAEAARERDHGVTAVTFTGDGQWIGYVHHGQLLRIPVSRAAPPAVVDEGPGVHDLTAIPRSSSLVYGHGGELVIAGQDADRAPKRLLGPTPEDVTIDTLRPSPDGRRIAFLETDLRPIPVRLLPDYLAPETRSEPIRRAFPGEPSEHYRVGIIDLAGGEPIYLDLEGKPEDLVFGIRWSPDGRQLLVDRADLVIKHRWIRLFDAATGHGRTVYTEADPHNVTAEWWADFSADGRSLAVVSDRGDDYQLWQVPLDGSTPRALTEGSFAVFDAATAPGGLGVIITANRGRPENRLPFLLPMSGHGLLPLATEPGHHEVLPSPDGRYLADLYSNDVTPPELTVRPLDRAGHPTAALRITHSPLPDYEGYPWAAAGYVEFRNHKDGTVIHGRLTLPPDFDPSRRYPAIIGSVYSNTVHNRFGGRIYHPTWALDQYLVHHGYVILNVDISGSSGYGKAFRQRIREDYGGVDVEDLLSAAQYLAATGYVDAKRIGLWGSSYGGLLTTMSLMKHPGVFAAGVAGAPATSLFHAETGEMRTMMPPEGREDRYRAASPFLYSDGLADPLLFIHGMRDDTVLFKDTMTLSERLILADKNFELAVLPNAPHGWDTQDMAQTRYAFRRLVEFFDRHLKAGLPR